MELTKDKIAEVLEKFRDDFDEAARKEIYQLFAAYLAEISRMSAGYRSRYEKIEPDENFFGDVKHLKNFNIRLIELLKKYAAEDTSGQSILQPYDDLVRAAAKKIPAIIHIREGLKYYRITRGLTITGVVRTIPANLKYANKKLQQNLANTIARLRRRTPPVIDITHHRHIPMRNILLFNFRTTLIEELTTIFTEVYRAKNKYLQILWDFDFEFDERLQKYFLGKEALKMSDVLEISGEQKFVEELQKKIADTKNDLKKKIDASFEKTYQTIENQISKVDSPELPKDKFSEVRLDKSNITAVAKFSQNHKKWENTHRALFNDWFIDVEVVLLYYSVLLNFYELKVHIHDFLDNKLNLNFGALKKFLADLGEKLTPNNNSAKSFLAACEKERQRLNEEFVDKMLADIVENLTGNFSDEIEKFKTKTIQFANNISNRRGLSKSRSYDKPIGESDINYISPRELLYFEALPVFEESVGKIKEKVEQSLEKARIKLLAAGSVADFALESAILLFDQKKNAVKTAEKITLEGIQRAADLIEEAAGLIQPVRNEPMEELQKAIHEFQADIQKLKDTENLFDLNLRIAQIRAIERSKNIRNDVIQWLRRIPPKTAIFVKNQLENTSEAFDALKDKIGISSPQKQISYEISVFIKQTELALKKLPFVYQRLYQLQPTNEDRFFL
jgi:hypothetical protein